MREFLWLVAKVEHPAVLTDDALHLLSHVDDQLGLDDGVVARTDHAHLIIIGSYCDLFENQFPSTGNKNSNNNFTLFYCLGCRNEK